MENKNFANELRTAFGNLVSLISDRVDALGKDIEDNLVIMQSAYDNIKANQTEIKEITEVVSEFAVTVNNCVSDCDDVRTDGANILADCVDLVNDGYIEDDDLDEDGEVDITDGE